MVLICPLDWGLGHASRCVQVIKALLSRKCKVVVAADGAPLDFLQKEFPQIKFIRFRGKAIRYPDKGSMMLKMLWQAPSFLMSIWKEHQHLKKLVKETGATLVISDNRYGLWNKNVQTVFITHQLFIKAPRKFEWVEPFLKKIIRFFVRKFDHCWVPDFPEAPGLSGGLSHKETMKGVSYVGPLSRFSDLADHSFKNPLPGDFPQKFILAIISGPEPQRSRFEEILRNQFEKTNWPVVFLLGKPGSEFRYRSGDLYFLDHADTPEFAWLIKNAGLVICRSGYSTLMDLSVFGKKALLVPTPGQTEQEYLAEMLAGSDQAHCVKQKDLNLYRDIKVAENFSGIKPLNKNEDPLNQALGQVLKDL